MGEREVTFEAEGIDAATLTHRTSRRQAEICTGDPSNRPKIHLQFTLCFRQNPL